MVVITVLAVALGSEEGPEQGAVQQTTTQAEETETQEEAEEAEEEEEPEPPPAPEAPPPVVIDGSGSEVESLRLATDTPLVVTAEHSGQANFIAELVPRGGGGSELLFNEIGPYSGQAAIAEASAGRYRVRVEADGAWTLRFEQPVPPRRPKVVPGVVRGQGAKVIAIRSDEGLQPVVRARHAGRRTSSFP